MDKVRIEIAVIVSDGAGYSHYDSKATGRENLELKIDARTVDLLPWPQICAGLVDAAYALYIIEGSKPPEEDE